MAGKLRVKLMSLTEGLIDMKSEIDRMIEDRRATRLINPVLTLFYLKEFQRTRKNGKS